MVFLQNRTVTKTKGGNRECSIAMTGLTMLFVGRMWNFGLWIRKAVDCFKGLLGDHTCRNMEDTDA